MTTLLGWVLEYKRRDADGVTRRVRGRCMGVWAGDGWMTLALEDDDQVKLATIFSNGVGGGSLRIVSAEGQKVPAHA